MTGYEHYIKVREDLCKLYDIITKKLFYVIAPRSVFLTTEQLTAMSNNPPPGGIERFFMVTEMPVTIEKMITAYEIGGEDFQLSFRYPHKDIPIIYETVQEYIRLWVDVKMNSYSYKTASINELKALESVSKSLFYAYKYYYDMEYNKRVTEGSGSTEFELANLVYGKIAYGSDGSTLSFISYVDQYYDRMQLTSDRPNVYISDKYLEPTKQTPITEMFEFPTMKHDIRNW